MQLYSAPKLRGLYLLSNVNMTARRSMKGLYDVKGVNLLWIAQSLLI